MPTNPFEPPKEVNTAAEMSPPVRVLLPWPTLGYWLVAFLLPTMMMLATTVAHVMGPRWLDPPGTGGLIYLVPLASIGLCWLVTLTGKASVATKFGWTVFTPIAVAVQFCILVVCFGLLFLAVDGLKGIQ